MSPWLLVCGTAPRRKTMAVWTHCLGLPEKMTDEPTMARLGAYQCCWCRSRRCHPILGARQVQCPAVRLAGAADDPSFDWAARLQPLQRLKSERSLHRCCLRLGAARETKSLRQHRGRPHDRDGQRFLFQRLQQCLESCRCRCRTASVRLRCHLRDSGHLAGAHTVHRHPNGCNAGFRGRRSPLWAIARQVLGLPYRAV